MWLWLLPALGAIFFLGALGITTKLALRTIEWQQIIPWAAICYGVAAIALMGFRGTRFPLGIGGFWALLTGICLSAGAVLTMLALSHAQVGVVVPITATYPILTLLAAAAFLSESITVPKVIGTLLVIAGAAVIGHWSS